MRNHLAFFSLRDIYGTHLLIDLDHGNERNIVKQIQQNQNGGVIMREGARRVIITVSALVLIGITVFCISGTVHSSEKVERREREKYYREIEAEYVKQVRFFLNEEGYSNSGVTMTKVIDEEENRSYTMTIHHRGIGNLQPEEQEQLQEELLQIRREKMEGVITYIFL